MQRDNLPGHYPREHYNKVGRSKKCYETEEEAIKEIKRRKLKTYVPYVCGVCNMWHIGRKENKQNG